jgi:tripartite ATP-independent transporter DctM subunit
MFVVISSSVLSMVLTYARIPEILANLLLSISHNKYVLLFLINVLLLILGMFLDPTPIILLAAPILFPIATQIGIDPVHFGVVFVMNMAIGQITPPVGATLYTTAKVANCPLQKMIKPMLPLIIIMFVMVLVISFIPPLVLTIPNSIMP